VEGVELESPPGRAPRKGMAWVPGGAFLMGSDDFCPEERPVHRVHVDGFWIDEHPGHGGSVPSIRAGDRPRDRG